ncbi:ATPase [Mycolicibacterium smegmatis]|uniref:ATPase n=2 Tax=Mycolicibacterium smegmatis (strain ATCC 700084 / mc(2)155) TaxID=246196 RepID=A0R394_MYCS2|nr:hypothetical protein MSMEG_5391 [Mycolicibacterium smegmatis MC2 155]AIU17036.1 ATPase [Mycolicibacterium smegmatis]AFP41686.1 hypothetical protein MSMEI_5243 [Mycolicibacterium smegmatis MC2 155]AIU10411.1 ATPase [Mycolicibacterium smegmatis MC2 155]AIU23659.1 ATPase [Mycolicibacterium smegmatis]
MISPSRSGGRKRRQHVRVGLPGADGGDLRAARPGAEAGRSPVIENVVGLILAVLIAVFIGAALLFPERF